MSHRLPERLEVAIARLCQRPAYWLRSRGLQYEGGFFSAKLGLDKYIVSLAPSLCTVSILLDRPVWFSYVPATIMRSFLPTTASCHKWREWAYREELRYPRVLLMSSLASLAGELRIPSYDVPLLVYGARLLESC
ncbi:hypothetical protein LZ32DRAFT_459589 [Colletotrichum eremochloae]|nr:hypothetical protein LZ32DRAFT_459589 [Colletotrichum eremochloae]